MATGSARNLICSCHVAVSNKSPLILISSKFLCELHTYSINDFPDPSKGHVHPIRCVKWRKCWMGAYCTRAGFSAGETLHTLILTKETIVLVLVRENT